MRAETQLRHAMTAWIRPGKVVSIDVGSRDGPCFVEMLLDVSPHHLKNGGV